MQTPITLLAADLANPEIQHGDRLEMESDVIHILRSAFLDHGVFHQRLLIRSFSNRFHHLRLRLSYDADFRDVFEIRGMGRDQRGELRKSLEADGRIRFRYQGLDGIARHTIIALEPAPAHLDCEAAWFELELPPRSRSALFIGASCLQTMEEATPRRQFLSAMKRQRREHSEGMAGKVRLESDNAVFNEILDRSAADLAMLTTPTPYGPYPYAGVPWFATPFGRDGIITALFLLWIDPTIAKGVLRYLAATQAKTTNPAADAEPGKILHELVRARWPTPARCRSVSITARSMPLRSSSFWPDCTGGARAISTPSPSFGRTSRRHLLGRSVMAISTAMAWSSMRRKPGAA